MSGGCASPAATTSHLRVPARYPIVPRRPGASWRHRGPAARSPARSAWDDARTFVPPVGVPMHLLRRPKLRGVKPSRGQSMVEFALVLPVLLLLMLVAI